MIYIEPHEGRYWLVNDSGKRVGSRFGYLTLAKAKSAKWFLINGREAIQATYRMKNEMSNELNHYKNI